MRALDLFCCAGGATKGLQDAGYTVTGVDIRPQPRYIGDRFVCDDAMAWLRGERESLSAFDLIWASPPCQHYSEATPMAWRAAHPDVLGQCAAQLRACAVPYILENVENAKRFLADPVMLCGSMFGLNIWRHRYFEIGNTDAFFLTPPCNHHKHPIIVSGRSNRRMADGRRIPRYPVETKQAALGTPWMTSAEMSECIPPVYSAFLARQIAPALSLEMAMLQGK